MILFFYSLFIRQSPYLKDLAKRTGIHLKQLLFLNRSPAYSSPCPGFFSELCSKYFSPEVSSNYRSLITFKRDNFAKIDKNYH